MAIYLLYLAILILGYYILRRLILENIFVAKNNKYILITGCDSGFGRLLSTTLLENGVNVFACCFTEEGMQSLETEWKMMRNHSKGSVYPLKLDVTNDENVQEVKMKVVRILDNNNATLWGLVNNAGIFTTFGPDDWCGTKEYMTSLNVNTLGAIRMCHAFVPLVKKSKGRIVTMGSSAGRLHGLYVAPYATAKFAVEGYMDCLRLELRQFGVSCHILEPGCFKTELLNHDANRERISRIWNNLPVETKNEYGDEYRKNFINAWEKGINVVANKNIQWVVDCYTHALFSWWPRLRYCPGWDAIFMFIPLSIVPTSIQDYVLTVLYALSPGPALTPSALASKCSKKEQFQQWAYYLAQFLVIPMVYATFLLKDGTSGASKSTVVAAGQNHTLTAE